MRPTRAFLASAGAGLSLVAAAVSVLFVFSAVVAVKGWPGMDPDNDVPTLVLSGALPPAAEGAGTGATEASPAAGAGDRDPEPIVLGGSDRADADRGAARRDGGGGPDARVPARTPGSGDAPSASGGSGGGQPSPGQPTPSTGTVGDETGSSPAPAPAVTDTAAGVVEGGGQAVGGATETVAPPVSGAVESVTGDAGGAVQDTGAAVDSATQGDVEGAVGSVGDAVGSLLGG